jgi:hypothetical protein
LLHSLSEIGNPGIPFGRDLVFNLTDALAKLIHTGRAEGGKPKFFRKSWPQVSHLEYLGSREAEGILNPVPNAK